MNKFTVGIVGLGLIGASFAKGFKKHVPQAKVLTYNRTSETVAKAVAEGASDGELNKDNIGSCDLILIALYPEAAIKYLEENAELISKDAIVTDGCGLKRQICREGFELARKFGFTFIGGHPMAGTQFSGYDNAKADMFVGASMILVPDSTAGDSEVNSKLSRIKSMLEGLKFGRFIVTTPEEHDRMIAMTSQMAHLVSSCYVKSPDAERSSGFTGGSFQDLTRVAYLNAGMWTELFLENKDNLLINVKAMEEQLAKYRVAIENSDADELYRLLDEGSRIKERIIANGQD